MLRSLEATAERRPDCPALDRLWNVAGGYAARSEVEAVLIHTATCAACSADWRLAAAIAEESGTARKRGSRFRGGLTPWALLAAALAGVAILVPWVALDREPRALYRDQALESAIRAPESNATALSRDAFVLRWSPVPDATSYSVDVTREDLTLLHAVTRVPSPEILVPRESLVSIPDGGAVLWRVTATMRTGEPVASAIFTTRVAGAP